MVLVNSGFYTQKNSSENYLQFGHAAAEAFTSLVLGSKSLRNISVKLLAAQTHVTSLSGALTSLDDRAMRIGIL
jgi:hypothetical protein